MGAGAGVYQRNVGALWDFYIAGSGWLIREGRLQCDKRDAFPEEDATLPTPADHDMVPDDTTSINHDSDPPYEEEYDGWMEDDHPMVLAMRDDMHVHMCRLVCVDLGSRHEHACGGCTGRAVERCLGECIVR